MPDAMTPAWDPGINLLAYSNVEAEENYLQPESLALYRDLLLQKSAAPAECIRTAVYRGSKLKVLELCAGSSRLLYALDGLGILEKGIGVEVSPSRHRFAEKWKHDLGADRVSNVLSAVDGYIFPDEEFDIIVLIDGALSYLYPCDPALPQRVLEMARNHLSPQGRLVLEFEMLTNERKVAMRSPRGDRVWYEGDDKDAFRYALYKTEAADWDKMVVQNISIYLSRNSADEKVKRELYKYYGKEELDRLFKLTGFYPEYFRGFDLVPFEPSDTSLVVLARRV